MEFFIPYLLASNPISGENIISYNNHVLTKYQVPFGMNEKKKLDFN
jgi:hypothetical protein